MDTVSLSGELEPHPNHRLEIVYRRIEELKPDSRNPRHHNRKQIKQLADRSRPLASPSRRWSIATATSLPGMVGSSLVANSAGPRSRRSRSMI
jgi:hypothetical protein